MTKIIIAPDSFKGTLTSIEAAKVIGRGVHAVLPDAELVLSPLADGGEGTATVLAPFLDQHQSLIESAAFIGLHLPEMRSITVEERGSSAIGDTILKALDEGKRDFIVALGGSATNEAGLGMLMRLGMDAWDDDGNPVEPTLAGLLKLDRIDISKLDKRLSECRFTILSDVMSPLCGKKGATATYGLQKGLQLSEIDRVDRAVFCFSKCCRDQFGIDVLDREGAGAAGGLGYALMLLGGEVVSGARFIMEATGFSEKLKGVDWVVTGEGCSDLQTMNGKLPMVVADEAMKAGVSVALLSGSIEADALKPLLERFDMAISAKPDGLSNDEAKLQAAALLSDAAATFAERMKRGD
ncbi:MAG: glycerate kinase [Mariprofundaceae bacterium]